MLFDIVWAVGVLDMFLRLLQGMEDAFVMHGLRKDLGNHRAIIPAQIGNDDLRVVTPSLRSGQALGP